MQGEAPVRAVAVDQSGTRLAVGSNDTNIRLWALKDGTVSIIKGHDNRVSVSFSRENGPLGPLVLAKTKSSGFGIQATLLRCLFTASTTRMTALFSLQFSHWMATRW